jgi:hypothetical protein
MTLNSRCAAPILRLFSKVLSNLMYSTKDRSYCNNHPPDLSLQATTYLTVIFLGKCYWKQIMSYSIFLGERLIIFCQYLPYKCFFFDSIPMKNLVKHVLLFSHNFTYGHFIGKTIHLFVENFADKIKNWQKMNYYRLQNHFKIFSLKIIHIASNAQNPLLEHRLTSK